MPRKKGFTLLEILIVIALAGIIIVTAISGYKIIKAKAKDATQKDDIERIKTALYEYNFDSGCFPKELPACGESFGYNNVNYLENLACRPNGSNYAYEVPNGDCPNWFKVLTDLEVEDDPSISTSGCSYGCGDDCNYNYGVSSTNIRVEKDCVKYFACAPGSACEEFEDPWQSQCPVTFINDDTCGGVDCSSKDNRCKNSSGKKVPD